MMKGNMSAEFLIVISVVVLFFMVFTAVYRGEQSNLYQVRDKLASTRNAYALSSALNFVYLAGDGAEYTFTLSGKDNNENITLAAHSIESKRTHSASQAPLLNGDVNTSSIDERSMIIRNNEGAIEIEE